MVQLKRLEWDVIGVVGEVFRQVSVLYNEITKYHENKYNNCESSLQHVATFTHVYALMVTVTIQLPIGSNYGVQYRSRTLRNLEPNLETRSLLVV